jgi:hypothetical protein
MFLTKRFTIEKMGFVVMYDLVGFRLYRKCMKKKKSEVFRTLLREFHKLTPKQQTDVIRKVCKSTDYFSMRMLMDHYKIDLSKEIDDDKTPLYLVLQRVHYKNSSAWPCLKVMLEDKKIVPDFKCFFALFEKKETSKPSLDLKKRVIAYLYEKRGEYLKFEKKQWKLLLWYYLKNLDKTTSYRRDNELPILKLIFKKIYTKLEEDQIYHKIVYLLYGHPYGKFVQGKNNMEFQTYSKVERVQNFHKILNEKLSYKK